jgi:hypothetical protein
LRGGEDHEEGKDRKERNGKRNPATEQ